MASIWESFRDCGSVAYLILFLSTIGVVASIGGAVLVVTLKNRRFAIVASAATLVFGILIAGAGAFGEANGRARTNEALGFMSASSGIDPAMREQIRAEGYKESEQCVSLGLGGSALPSIVGLVLLTVSLFMKKQEGVEK
jgi:hypothetical protein